ncbi:hypothetical protein LshimejAT787_0600770 [Lyophyllum shimeji]|uniref:Uncharacterized protein n=1 Tax=Lyophyllum shimeji TaxID=47721 RepID=A0A9P3PN31_LYOSH|nr:hypothetical protein LshimejAT787_0600770 [Lyophyllum shimeji]
MPPLSFDFSSANAGGRCLFSATLLPFMQELDDFASLRLRRIAEDAGLRALYIPPLNSISEASICRPDGHPIHTPWSKACLNQDDAQETTLYSAFGDSDTPSLTNPAEPRDIALATLSQANVSTTPEAGLPADFAFCAGRPRNGAFTLPSLAEYFQDRSVIYAGPSVGL